MTAETGADITFQAGDSVVIGNDFTVELGATLSVTIGTPSPTVRTFTYDYQDIHYFLTEATGGAAGDLSWTYDEIGNRLSEDRTGPLGYSDEYTYVLNGSSRNTPILDDILRPPGGGGQRSGQTYTHGDASSCRGALQGRLARTLPPSSPS